MRGEGWPLITPVPVDRQHKPVPDGSSTRPRVAADGSEEGAESRPGASTSQSSRVHSRIREARSRFVPLVVALAVAAVYAAAIGHWFHAGHSPREFVYVGQEFVQRSDASPAIRHGPVQPTSWTGFDGQFFYYIALDPRR